MQEWVIHHMAPYCSVWRQLEDPFTRKVCVCTFLWSLSNSWKSKCQVWPASPNFYRPQMKLREGNIVTEVSAISPGTRSPLSSWKEHGTRQKVISYPLEGRWDQTGCDIIPPEQQKWAVRILLECFLVDNWRKRNRYVWTRLYHEEYNLTLSCALILAEKNANSLSLP